MLRKSCILFWACLVILGLGHGFLIDCAGAATVPLKAEKVASGLQLPLFVCAPPGDTKRLFILEQIVGRIRILDLANGSLAATPFLTVTGITTGGEQGLLGLAFHPGYATNGYFYVNYTTSGGGAAGRSEITRFTAQGDPVTSSTADPASKLVILQFDQPESNHNGGWLGFGLDGFLYISSGDGGGGDDRHEAIGSGQDRNTLLGKILRIDVNTGPLYGIPDGNPFKGDAAKRQEIWAFGLRNPWRCSNDRATGDLWIGDVGQNAREEIDFTPAGLGGVNFGWRPREGLIQNPAYDGDPYPAESPVTVATDPVYDYGRSVGTTVIGGYVYRGRGIPDLRGEYVFADLGGRFWTFTPAGSTIANLQERTAELNPGSPKLIANIASFGEDADGELYICSYSNGEIYKIVTANGYEADLAPRPNGNNNAAATITDWVQAGRFAAGLDTVTNANEFMRADCAPRLEGTNLALGNGIISITDWVQAGRYAAGLDPVTLAGGPAGSTTAGLASTSSSPINKSIVSKRTLRLAGTLAAEGQLKYVPVELTARGNENAAGFSVQYNPAALRFAEVRSSEGETGAAIALVNRSQENIGRVGLAFALPAGQTFGTGQRVMVEIGFTALAGSAGSTTRIHFGDEPVKRELADALAGELPADFVSGTLRMAGANGTGSSGEPPFKLEVIGWRAPDAVLFRLVGERGARFWIEASEDLTVWHPLRTVTLTENSSSFEERTAGDSRGHFYRAVPTP